MNPEPNTGPATSDFTSTTHTVGDTKNDTIDPMDIDMVVSPTAPVKDDIANTETSASSSSDIHCSSEVLERVLYRLTGGLPKCELNFIIQESNDCEVALLEEIRILEEALAALSNDEDNTEMKVDELPDDPTNVTTTTIDESTLHSILESPMTPLDRFYTASALLGRLRNDMAVPSVSSMKDQNRTGTTTATVSPSVESNEDKAFEEFMDPTSLLHTVYTKTVVDQETLLSLWKKISVNRAAFVFKRPVKSEEAPGYTDRIYFPMDLSLIRKRIITNNIQTYVDFHDALALISHNCVKYNGRDSDYGRVARDFEATVDHIIVQAVRQAASNVDGATKETETRTPGITISSDCKSLPETPISAIQESPATKEPLKEDVDTSSLSASEKNTNLTGITTTANDAKPEASSSNAGITDEAITSS